MPAISDPAIDRMVGNISRETINRFLSSKDSNYKPSQKVFENGQSNAGALFPTAFRDTFQSFSICGYSTELNLFVFLIRLKRGKSLGERSCRKLQFDYAKTILKKDQGNFIFHDALTDWLRESKPFILSQAIFIFADEQQRFRFSLVENADINTMTAKRFRRYTFYVDPAEKNRTFIDRMAMDWSSFDKIKEAFSVERLSNEFFDEYKRIYQNFVEFATGKRMVKQGGKWVEAETREPNAGIMSQFAQFGDGEKAFRDYVKKMMGRLVFLQFLQKKGWLGVPEGGEWGDGDRNYLQNLFNSKSKEIRNEFLEKVLEPLFFKTLNTDRGEAGIADKVLSVEPGKAIRIPYLNGGLFEKDALDDTVVQFPATFFARSSENDKDGLLDIFDRFNFTIDENDEDSAEIGVDPEMLGRIFENLLEDNKDKGAFYTPKEIVRYMCRESLIQYLGDTEEVRELVTGLDAEAVPPERKKPLSEKLKAVKVCDPAIGSGAFPMGMLELLLKLRIKLGDVADTSEGRLAAKKEIIQNNLYGVDIDAGAVDIARLRFWLSIVVDKTDPTPLPNFDYKIMQGNSLLEQFEGIDLSEITLDMKPERKEKDLTPDMFAVMTDDDLTPRAMKALMDYYYGVHDPKAKHEIRERLNRRIATILKKKVFHHPDAVGRIDNIDWEQKPFFLWHTYFMDVFRQGGFDIVIGNPPYGANIDPLLGEYDKLYHKVIQNFAEIYKIFFCLGFSLVRPGGILSYITPDTFLTQPRYKDLRNFLRGTSIKIIVDLGENVFPLVTVPVCITLLRKLKPVGAYDFLDLKHSYAGDFNSPKYTRVELSGGDSILPTITGKLTLNDVLELKDPGIQYHKHGNRGENTLYQRLFAHQKDAFAKSVSCWYGKLVTAYRIAETDEFFNTEYRSELEKNESVSFTREVFDKSPKFLWRQTAPYLTAAIDFDRRWHRNTLQCGFIRDEYAQRIDPYFMLAVLNSSYLAYCYDAAVRETGRTFPQIRLTFLKPLPMVIPDEECQRRIRARVIALMSCPDEQFAAAKTEIDEMILNCFGLSEQERRAVRDFETQLENFSRAKKKHLKTVAAAADTASQPEVTEDEEDQDARS